MNFTVKNKLNMSRGTGQVLTVTAGLVFLCIVFGIINPNFFSGRNISNLLRQIAPILIIGIGQSYVLITGNIKHFPTKPFVVTPHQILDILDQSADKF